MSKIEDLIKEYCPDGVEYKKLDAVTTYERPDKYSVKSTAYDDAYETPVLTAGKTFILGYTNETDGIYQASKQSPVIIFDDFLAVCKWVDFPFKVKSSAMKFIHAATGINVRYLFYAMECIDYVPVDHARQWIATYSQFEIPVPPLPVQQEIVRILDSFTALQDELQKELEERKKQFEHVRDQLMNNGSDVILSDVAEYSKGRVSASEMTTENYVGVDNLLQNKAGKVSATFVPAKGNVIRFERNDILIGNIRPYLKKIWLADTNGGTNGDVLCIHVLDSSSVNPRYLYFVLSSDAFFAYDTVNVRSSGKMPRGDKESVMKYSFTLPSLQEQNDIVRKLESMSEYIYDAIPEELSLRQQQYTYYRDKLLSFPRKEA